MKWGKGMVQAAPQRERVHTSSFVLSSYLSLAGGNLRGVFKRAFQQNIYQFPSVPFRVMVSIYKI